MWQNDLGIVKKRLQHYEETLNDGASQTEIDNFLSHSKLSIPDEYLQMLKKFNGIEYNSYKLYGIDSQYLAKAPNQSASGLEDLNGTWHENDQDLEYLYLGEDDISFYVYHIDEKTYLVVDRPGGDVMERSENLDGLLDIFFSDAIL